MGLLRVFLVFMLAAPLAAQSPAASALAAARAAVRARDYTGALHILQAEGLQQDPEILLMQAAIYQAGRAGDRDDARAYRLTRRAAALGSVEAQYRLGRMLLSGKGVAQNRPEGQAWITKAAEAGHGRAAALLVRLLQSPAPAPAPAPASANVPARGSEMSRRLGWTPLMEAAQRARPALLESLLPGANLNAQDREGRTALMLAVRAGNAAAVDMLLRAGADPGLVDSAGMTALGFAAQGGDELVLRMLLTAGARPDVPDRQGRTPLEQAIASGHGEMATLMLDNPGLSLTGALLRRMWFLAARQGPPGLISALAARGGACALQDAAGLTALDHAAETGNLALLRHCPQGATPPLLLRAVRAGQTGFAMALLAAGVDPDGTSARGNTALLIAAHKGNLLLARALLNRGADVDHRNAAGNSALMLAAENGHEALITMLLDAGADTGLRNKRREKARDIALAAGYPALARRLE